MEKRLLLTRSRHDPTNSYLYAYCEGIMSYAQGLGWDVNKMDDEDNTAEQLHSRLSKITYNFVFFNGHGHANCILGYKNKEILVTSGGGLLNGAISYARSCDALNDLGKRAVEKGCLAFIGYKTKFLLPYANEYISSPLRDPVAKPVLEVSNLIPKLILKGTKVKTAVKAAKAKSISLIFKMLGSIEPFDAASFRALLHNHDALDFEGNPDACVK
ncbi:MAG: hypothetical protein ABIH83_00950 [Candidatus Micrarchaeota archaeon]